MVEPSFAKPSAGWLVLMTTTWCLACGAGGKSGPVDASSSPTGASDSAEISETEPTPVTPVAASSEDSSASTSEESQQALIYPDLEPSADAASSAADNAAGDDESVSDSTVTVIESPGQDSDSDRPSLVEAAAAERARRRTAPPTQIVITDKNLSEYAVGQLTVTEGAEEGGSDDSMISAELEEKRVEEEYWRSRGLEIRMAWAEAAERAEELEADVFLLRQRFYAEDDGFYRDSQIKPAWDRAIEQLQETRKEIEQRQEELQAFLEEGRAAGALPGWLREGVDLEPEPEPEEEGVFVDPDRHEYDPGEPVVVEEHERESGL
ncbi:MAG: hypothetical protein P8Y44_04225 [Acidobacteriota bacterium]